MLSALSIRHVGWTRRALSLLLLVSAVGCAGSADSCPFPAASVDPQDDDLDGYPKSADCNDQDFAVNPAAPELCDGLDNNCDGSVDGADAADASTWCADADGDGSGGSAGSVVACAAPDGYTTACDDCDDGDASVFPGAQEVCDDIDDDCDGLVDDADPSVDLSGERVFHPDADGDSYGDPGESQQACVRQPGWVEDDTDCNDGDPTVNPAGTEICNEIDDDCDGAVDNGIGATWYLDQDGDGYGDLGNSIVSCSQPPGYVADSTDCVDDNDAINPGAVETPDDGVDQDCTGADLVCDQDGDAVYNLGCGGGDCNDADDTIFPGATEVPDDGIDQDCTAGDLICDQDGDGYYNAACGGGDCDDANDGVHPGATEIPGDGVDQDCDTFDIVCDVDGDGFATTGCGGGDCDDASAVVHPGVLETCNGLDDDCDGAVDDADPDVIGRTLWFFDADGDGYGDPTTAVTACLPPPGFIVDGTDCDDTRAAIHPGAAESCNGADDDCNGVIDEGVTSTWYPDSDGDGFGDPTSPLVACAPPPGYITDSADCDDTDASAYPGAIEIRNDGIDQDCDGFDAVCNCPSGFVLTPASDGCVQSVTVPATYNGTPYNVCAAVDSAAYGWKGASFPGGTTDTATYWTGKLNAVGAWACQDSVLDSNTSADDPLNTWIGFAVCVNLTSAGDFLVGAAGDNGYRLRVDGVSLGERLSATSSDQTPFNSWFISVTSLSSGPHVIELYGLNQGSSAAFGAEVAGPFLAGSLSTDAEMDAADYAGNLVFSSGSIASGDVFELGESTSHHGYSCPDGYAWDACGTGVDCVQATYTTCE